MLIEKFRNPWYCSRNPGSKEFYYSKHEAEEYKSFYIVTDANIWVDVVESVELDGVHEWVCVTQRGSVRNAKAYIDSLYESLD